MSFSLETQPDHRPAYLIGKAPVAIP